VLETWFHASREKTQQAEISVSFVERTDKRTEEEIIDLTFSLRNTLKLAVDLGLRRKVILLGAMPQAVVPRGSCRMRPMPHGAHAAGGATAASAAAAASQHHQPLQQHESLQVSSGPWATLPRFRALGSGIDATWQHCRDETSFGTKLLSRGRPPCGLRPSY